MEHILIVDDEAFIRENLERILAEEGYRPFSTDSPDEALKLVGEEDIDLVLLDLNLGAQSGLDVLRSLRELDPGVLVIIITGYGTVESAVEALKIGAYDYIKKPFKADAIRLIVKLALETQAPAPGARHLRREGQSKEICSVRPTWSVPVRSCCRSIARCARSPSTRPPPSLSPAKAAPARNWSPGPSTTFRPEAAALSSRSTAALCRSICSKPNSSAMNGVRSPMPSPAKSACSRKRNGGTIFLDEIGEMDLNLQVKLLRVLEDRKIRRLGGTSNIDIDVRVIAATNRNLKEAIEEKAFREDLYYRLNVFPIHIPALRERREDIPPLLDYFLKRFSREFNKRIREISRDALDLLMRYHWPGNVRELRNVVERICIMRHAEVITPDFLPLEIWGEAPRKEAPFSFDIPPRGVFLEEVVGQLEKELIAKAIAITGGNVAKTARLLNVPRGTLRYKLEKYELASEP